MFIISTMISKKRDNAPANGSVAKKRHEECENLNCADYFRN